MRKKLQYPSVSRVINVPVPYPVVPGGDFCDFDLVQKSKAIQQGSFNNLVVIPTPYPVVLGGNYTKFVDVILRPKPIQEGFITQVQPIVAVAAFQPYVFTQFDQPQPRKGFTYSFDDGWTGIGTPVQNFVFTAFSQPSAVKSQQPQSSFVGDLGPAQTPPRLVFADFDLIQSKHPQQEEWIRFQVLPPTPVVSTPVFTGFTDFGTPITRKPIQPDIPGTMQPQVVAVVQPYVFSLFEQPQFRNRSQDQPVQFNLLTTVQSYVFSKFEQPQFKKQINDQPTWFNSSVVFQPYIFSDFSQPRPLRYQTDANIQTSYYPIVIIPPPNFTGFNDFGLPQQLLGIQQKQDGGYIQFTVLPMPQVVSPYFFTGFSSFQELLPNTSPRQRELIGLGSDFTNVIIPVIQIPPPDVIVGGGGYRFMGGYHKYDKPQTIHTDAVRKAAAVLSKMGGEARAKSLTPTQRSNIASTAANTRWNPKK